ncbi:MAG: twin-arginine translocase subunit TatC [Infirmifilum sp.]
MTETREKPLMEHAYELLETIRKILILWVSIILFLLVFPTPHLLPEYIPVTFYLMNITKQFMFSYEKHPILSSLYNALRVNSSNIMLISHGWFDSLTAALIMAALTAIVFSMPITLYLVYKFLEPGLHPHEKRNVKKLFASIAILFMLGFAYGFLIVLPLTFLVALWITQLVGAAPLFSIKDFYQNVFIGSLAVGVFFMMPLAVLTLGKIGMLTYEMLRKNWQYVFFFTLAFLVVITPDPTPTSAIALGVPFLGLYFLSMWLLKKSK